ncbi:hypothetical protein [Bacteroides ndongoniae]|nr:hypothetical protein [Bacteroides ndongoniae]
MVSTFPQVEQPKVLSWATHGNGLGDLQAWDKCKEYNIPIPDPCSGM